MRLTIVCGMLALLVLGVSLMGCVSEELSREVASEELPPDYLTNGQVEEDLAKEFDALPDDSPKKVKHRKVTQ